MGDNVGLFKGRLQIATDYLPNAVRQMKLLHLLDGILLECVQRLG